MNVLTISTLVSLALAGTVNIDIHKKRSSSDRTRGNRLIREAFAASESDYVPESLSNGFYSYYASLYIGSNQQLVTPAIDTGSSDLWTMLSSNPYCHSDFNCTNQTFDPAQSTTFRNLSKPWDIQYLDTTGAFGWLSQDTVTIDGKSVKNAYFAAANIANSSEDVFGVGLTGQEATIYYHRNGTTGGYTYPNIPISLKQQGFIDHVSYSLYLNGVNASDGQILFGGVDRAKYEDELALVPLVNIYAGEINSIIEFTIMLHGLSIRSGENSCSLADTNIPVLLDSGTSYAILPNNLLDAMGTAMGYTWDNTTSYYQGSCNPPFHFDSFELNFSGKKLQVPPATLLDTATDLQNNPIYGPDGKQQCILAVQGTDYVGDLILGDVFLRNFYVVYDLENLQIGLAQTKFDEEESADVVPIVSSVPGATSAPGYANTYINTKIRTYGNYSRCEYTPKTSSSSAAAASSQTSFSTQKYSSQHSTIISVSGCTTCSATGSATGSAVATSTASEPAGSGSGSSATGTGAAGSAAGSAATGSGVAGSAAATGTVTAGGSGHGVVAAASKVVVETTKYTTIPCSTPTTFSYNSQTYTVTEATTLTVEDCGCTETPVAVGSTSGPAAGATEASTAATGSASTSGPAAGATEASTSPAGPAGSAPAESAPAGSGPAAPAGTAESTGAGSGPSTASGAGSAPSTSPGAGSGSGSGSAESASAPAAPAEGASKTAASAGPSAASSAGETPSVGAVASSPSTATPALANGAAKLAAGGLSGLMALVLLL